MAIVRDLGITLPAMTPTILITCAETMTTAASTSPAPDKGNSTADLLVSPTAGTNTTAIGNTIDRLAAPLSTLYNVAMPSAWLNSTRGSTEANRQIQIGVRLQHGDSSAGGDMVDYSTQGTGATRTYFGTARTTDMLNWELSNRSTGPLFAASNPCYYDLRGAKQYIRAVGTVGKNRVTTESSGDEHAHFGMNIVFIGAENLPQTADDPRSPFSSSTSTA